MAPRDPREMTDEELQALVGGAQSQNRDPREMSDDELAQAAGVSSSDWSVPGAKRALSNIREEHLKSAKSAASGVAEGIVHLMAMPQDMANMFTEALVNKRYLQGSPEAIASLKKLGLDYDPEPNEFTNNVIKKTAELGGGAGASGFILKSFATALSAGRYIPQLATQAQTVFQRLMREAADNPTLISQEIKAGNRAGAAHGVLKQLYPEAPWWATFLAELGGGATANPRKPSPLTVEGQEERVANTLADLNAGNRQNPGVDNKAALQDSLARGRDSLTNPDGTPKVENFEPTSAQQAVTPNLLPDGSVAETRNLGPYEKAALGGTPELTAKLEGQARAINQATENSFQNSDTLPHEVDPSAAGQAIRQDLLAARTRQQAETENAYRNVNEKASTGMNQLVDDLIGIRATRNEADRASDMPAEVDDLLKTFEANWPGDATFQGQPLDFQGFMAKRAEALASKDPQALADTDQLMNTFLRPEKQMGLLKDWRTRVMGELERSDVAGKLKLRLGQLRGSLENAIDSFGVGPGGEAENFRLASKEARKLKETFDSGQVGAALEKEWGRHVLPESDVPAKFTSANRQPESWDSLVAASGDPSVATQNARRIVQQRFQAQTTNAPQTPEGVRTPSSEKFNNFLKNPDNKELLVKAFGQEHYDRLRTLEEMARVRESILRSPAVGGSNSAEKLKAMDQLKSGKELDKLFSSLTLRLGFVARAGRKATEMVYGDANDAMDRMYRDALIDPEYLSGLLSRSRSREAFRARQKYRLYLTQQPAQAEEKLRDEDKTPVDLSDLLDSDMAARAASTKYLQPEGYPDTRGYAAGGKVVKALAAKWFSPLEKAVEEAPAHLNHTLDNWLKYLRGRTTQFGNSPVKDEELEAVWPTAMKLAINPEPDVVHPGTAKFKRDQILEAVREANKAVQLPEFQTYDPIKKEDITTTEEPSPLRTFSRVIRPTEDSPLQFEMMEYANAPGRMHVIPEDPNIEPYIASSSQPLRQLMDLYNRDAGPKYGEHSKVRLPGGSDYKETVVGSSLSQPMSIDNAHFGSVPGVGQSQVSWSLHHNRFQEGLEPHLPEDGIPDAPAAPPMTFTDQDVIARIRDEVPFLPEGRHFNGTPEELWENLDEGRRQQVREQHAQDTGRVHQPDEEVMAFEPDDAPAQPAGHYTDEDIIQHMIDSGMPEADARRHWETANPRVQQEWRNQHGNMFGGVWQPGEIQPAPLDDIRHLAQRELTPDDFSWYTEDPLEREMLANGVTGENLDQHQLENIRAHTRMRLRNTQAQDDTANFTRANQLIHDASDGGEDVQSYLEYLRRQTNPRATLDDDHTNGLFGAGEHADWLRDYLRGHLETPRELPARPNPDAAQPKKALQAPPPPKPTGAKVTFIDELQSYRHQKGASEGYRISEDQRKKLVEKAEDARLALEQLIKEEGLGDHKALHLTDTQLDSLVHASDGRLKPAVQEFRDAKQAYNQGVSGRVPDGPYKKSWPLLQFRRMLWQSAQDGSDWLAWNSSKEVQKHGTNPGIADHIYDKTLPSIAKKEARRLGLPEDSVKRISIGKSNDQLTKGWDDKLRQAILADPEDLGPEIMDHMDYLSDNFSKANDAIKKVLTTREYNMLGNYLNEYRKVQKKWRAIQELPGEKWGDEEDRVMDDYHQLGSTMAAAIQDWDLVNKLGLRGGGNSWGIRLTPEVRKKILEEGLPKFMVPATVGTGVAARGDRTSKDTSLTQDGEGVP